MKHTVVAGLAWLVGILDAHPTAASAESSLKTSALDAAKYRMPTLSEYADNNEVVADSSIMSLMAGSYIDTATAVVKNIAPEATFRLVDDHYVGESGIGHVRFRQTHHGIDIDNADINVNVRIAFSSLLSGLMTNSISNRLPKMVQYYHTATASTMESCLERAPLLSVNSLTPRLPLLVSLRSWTFLFKPAMLK